MVRAAISNEAEAVAELAKLNHILASTSLGDKRRLSETRDAIRDLELRLDAYRRSAVSPAANLIEAKKADLVEARAQLARLEKLPAADKGSLSSVRAKICDIESALGALRLSGRRSTDSGN